MTDEELRVLAWTLLGEAAGEGTRGMEAVAHVIRNRAASGRFPSNPATVALQPNQFSTWNPISQGGNLPRARYPVGSSSFNQAMEVVQRVFGDRPGPDPTQGATHYYSPQGMTNRQAPYWWPREAALGEKRIGNHIFAVKNVQKEAPIPRDRPGSGTGVGRFPTEAELRVFRTGQPERLPVIGPRYTPTPATQSLEMQVRRENAGATVRSSQTLIYDPVQRTLVPSMPTASQAKKNIPQSQIERAVPTSAKKTQQVAGFSVPGGTSGISAVDRARQLASQTPTYAREPLPQKKSQTQFAPSTIPGANTATNSKKDQSRLQPTQQRPPTVDSGGFSRDALARRQQAMEELGLRPQVVAPPAPPKVAPVPMPPIARPPVQVATPQNTSPLKITVQRDPIVQTVSKTPVQQLREQGYSPQAAYDKANQDARDRAIENSSNPSGNSTRAGLAERFGFD